MQGVVAAAGELAYVREQLRLAAESANEARKQVVTAIRQARRAWRQLKDC